MHLLESPDKEISDFNPAVKTGGKGDEQQSFPTFQISQIIINNYKGSAEEEKSGFAFPDGGWVCSSCQNYNFSGRGKCNRCRKTKTRTDFNGKPKHLQRHQQRCD